jgi:hypothetical protein
MNKSDKGEVMSSSNRDEDAKAANPRGQTPDARQSAGAGNKPHVTGGPTTGPSGIGAAASGNVGGETDPKAAEVAGTASSGRADRASSAGASSGATTAGTMADETADTGTVGSNTTGASGDAAKDRSPSGGSGRSGR